MTIDQAQNYIKQYKLAKELEPILEQHRYARIDMKVTYNISGENESLFVIKKFNQAIESDDRTMALSIEKFIIKKVLNKTYTPEILQELYIPTDPAYAGIAMNRLWLMHKKGLIDDEKLQKEMGELAKLNPANEYIAFNNILLQLNNPSDLFKNIGNSLQIQIDRLYFTSLKKETVDGLNIKLQFKLIDEVDSLTRIKSIKIAAIEKIKQIVDIKEESLENSLKLAELFIENKDYLLAIKTLEPWISQNTTNERVLFTYVSLCSLFENKMHTSIFNLAMKQAHESNPERFCEMFKKGGFSFRVFENSEVKSEFCSYCHPDTDVAAGNHSDDNE
jgi:hypothetical protein